MLHLPCARSLRALVISVSTLWLAGPASAAPLLYMVAADDAVLRTIDASDASTVSSVSISLTGELIEGANGLARHPSTGVLYALLKLQGQPDRELVTVDPATGVAQSVGDTQHKMAGLAFGPNDASGDPGITLYGVTGDQQFAKNPKNPESLFTLSLSTGAAAFVRQLGNGSAGETIAFRPGDPLLYHASGTHFDQVFETVDIPTGVTTDIPLSGDAFTEPGALTWGGSGIFFLGEVAAEGAPSGRLYRLGAGGVATEIGPLGVLQPKGFVLVPEPASAGLLAAGLAALGLRRRRRAAYRQWGRPSLTRSFAHSQRDTR